MIDLIGEAATAFAQLRMPFHQVILSAAAKPRSRSICPDHLESRAGARSYRGPDVILRSRAGARSYRGPDVIFRSHAGARSYNVIGKANRRRQDAAFFE